MNKATRDAYGKALAQLKDNPDVVALEADLGGSTKSAEFKKVAPERYFNMGIAEANMVSTAAGLAASGKIAFASTFAMFATARAFEQIRNAVCYPNLNVKIVGSHAGISVGADGGTHQPIEDIAIMRALPNMKVVCPADDVEAEAATKAAAEIYGPFYLRMGRSPVPTFHNEDYKFEFGKGDVIREGTDCTVIATGLMVVPAMNAVKKLAEEGISCTLINMHTIKPIDAELIIKEAQKTGRIVTAEEASIIGGLGSAVAEVLAENCSARLKRIGVRDEFGQSGSVQELLDHYGLNEEGIISAVKELL